MDSLGIAYSVEAPGVDEDVPLGTRPEDAVVLLAERKARAVAQRHPDALVIGSDQLAVVGGEALGTPPDRAAARAQLQKLRARPHVIATGVCVVGPGFHETALDTAQITFHAIS
ncbi:MAG: Maf family protein, partial [Myxococcaceae bacterium]